MLIVAFLILGGAVALTVVVLAGLRSWMYDRERLEEEIRRPDHQTLVYDVPEGQDPAVLGAALARAGFVTVADSTWGEQRVMVECPQGKERDRARVREIIEHTTATSLDGGLLILGGAKFEDEG